MVGAREVALEAVVCRLWQAGSLSGCELHTLDERRLFIIEPGQPNQDAGPDFLDALLRIDDELVRGDVEVHTQASDWYAHHHDSDPRYNHVVLHVITHPCPDGFVTRVQNGSAVPVFTLTPHLQSALAGNASEENAPAHPAPECLLAAKPHQELIPLVEEWGVERLFMHAAQFLEMRSVASWEQILHFGLFDALGYGKNQPPFRRLAQLLPIETIRAVMGHMNDAAALACAEALLFGAAGLLSNARLHSRPLSASQTGEAPITASGNAPSQSQRDETEAYQNHLAERWKVHQQRLALKAMEPEAWQFFRLRPCNFPTRRIAAAAVLVTRFRQFGLLPGLRAILSAWRKDPAQAILALDSHCMVDVTGYWAGHYDFSSPVHKPRHRQGIRLIGRGRSREIAVNLFMPVLLAYAMESEDGHLRAVVRALYAAYPRLPENSVSRNMWRKLFGKSGAVVPLGEERCRSAAWQQGLIQLYKMRCRRGKCDECAMLL